MKTPHNLERDNNKCTAHKMYVVTWPPQATIDGKSDQTFNQCFSRKKNRMLKTNRTTNNDKRIWYVVYAK